MGVRVGVSSPVLLLRSGSPETLDNWFSSSELPRQVAGPALPCAEVGERQHSFSHSCDTKAMLSFLCGF